jgi:cell division protein ZapA (FtsZ GTPase activity inhibitor)
MSKNTLKIKIFDQEAEEKLNELKLKNGDNYICNYHDLLNINGEIDKKNQSFVDEKIKYLSQTVDNNIIEQTINSMKNSSKRENEICVMLKINVIYECSKLSSNFLDSFNNMKLYDKPKYLNSRIDLLNLKINRAPDISFTKNNIVNFYNGRNRFLNLRDLGLSEMPFILTEKSYKNYIKYINVLEVN